MASNYADRNPDKISSRRGMGYNDAFDAPTKRYLKRQTRKQARRWAKHIIRRQMDE